MEHFKLVSKYQPTGDQPQAIEALVKGFQEGNQFQTLLGVTGSGKTFTMANVIAALNKPTLIISHNKTLAAQLCSEFKEIFPENAVEYFVSYYDYYQPEAYIPYSDTYIEKDAQTNDEIDKLRHSATAALFERKDVIIVASVSCIYGLGDPIDYNNMVISLRPGMIKDRDEVIAKLIEIKYERNDINFSRNKFRVRGDVLDIFPSDAYNTAVRVEFFGDEVERITEINTVTGEVIGERKHIAVYPASHYVTTPEKRDNAIISIEKELEERLKELRNNNKLVEAQRLEQRTKYDMEMLRETGFCNGIENYSRHLSLKEAGETPTTLMDFFPKDYLLVIDESHVTIPQVRAMYNGDRMRKQTLVDYGFRLPSALDNRPLKFEEFNEKINEVIYVSATPGDYELSLTGGKYIEQIIRPTGLLDPIIEVRPIVNQIDDLVGEINKVVERNERVLVTTLTKKMSEDLTNYLKEVGIKVKYLHSDIVTLERTEIIRDLRLGKFDVLVGINLLREGLDIPEVSLIAILDADKEGFLRSETSLIQTVGRAARNAEGRVIMYADKITRSMAATIEETARRRQIQSQYNEEHGIIPRTIKKDIRDNIETLKLAEEEEIYGISETDNKDEIKENIEKLQAEMMEAATNLQFERAAQLRDKIKELEEKLQK